MHRIDLGLDTSVDNSPAVSQRKGRLALPLADSVLPVHFSPPWAVRLHSVGIRRVDQPGLELWRGIGRGESGRGRSLVDDGRKGAEGDGNGVGVFAVGGC